MIGINFFRGMALAVLWFIPTFSGAQEIVEPAELNPNDVRRGKHLLVTPKTQPALPIPVQSKATDPSALWFQAFLNYESCLELGREGKYLEALNKCNEAIALYDGLAYRFPDFQPKIVEFKRKIVSETRLRILDRQNVVPEVRSRIIEASNKAGPVGVGLSGGGLLLICICIISAMIMGFILGLVRKQKQGGPIFDNKMVAISIFLLFAATLIFGLASLFFGGYFDLAPRPKSVFSSGASRPAPPVAPPGKIDKSPSLFPTPKPYDPKPKYPAPGPDDPPLHNTHDLVDAYLRAPNWKARLPYIYHGDQLKSEIGAYYKKWPDFSLARFKMKLFQMELEEEYGGPFWVYQITKNDADDGGVPLIIRIEDGNLKVDWEVYSEFDDRQFVKFKEVEISGPHDFKLVAERVSEYSGPNASHMNSYDCYEVNPPYGGYRAYSEYAFVKKGSELATRLGVKMGLGDDPLAVVITLDKKDFGHGETHLIITDFVSEGWFEDKK